MSKLSYWLGPRWTTQMLVILRNGWPTGKMRNTHLSIPHVQTRLWRHNDYIHCSTNLTPYATRNPWQQFITDLIKQITLWRQQKKEILISMDVNKDVDNPKSKISSIFTETDLVDLHNYCHPATSKPAMDQGCNWPIDLMLGTPLFAAALTAAWMLPFGKPLLIKGDHRLLGTDFHPGILFGSTPHHPASSLIRGINSHHEQHVLQFCQDVIKKCNKNWLDERIKDLFDVSHLDTAAIAELENINQTLTKILVKADQNLRPLSPMVPGSSTSIPLTSLLDTHSHG